MKKGTIDDLKRFADVAGKCLESITLKKGTSPAGYPKSSTPEELLAQAEAKSERLFDTLMGLLGLVVSFALLFLFHNSVLLANLATGIKIFFAVSVFLVFLNISPRIRKSPVVTTFASIVLGVLTNFITEWLSR